MKGTNPFLLWANKSFINGRKNEQRQFKSFLNAIASGQQQGIMIVGIPGMGKSTIMEHFASETDKEKLFAIRVRAAKGERLNSFLGRINYEIRTTIAEKEPTVKYKRKYSNNLKKIIQNLEDLIGRKRRGVVIFIDDVDLLKEQKKLYKDVTQLLSTSKKVGFVFSGNNKITPLPERFRIMKLGRFDEHDIREFVSHALKKGPPKMGEECLKSIINDSEGNPRIVTTMCWVIYDRIKDNEKVITKGHYLAFFPAIMSMLAREFFDGMYLDTPEAERRLLIAFAGKGTVHISDVAKEMQKKLGVITTLAMRLVKRGELIKVERGQYRIFTRLFGKYVLGQSE